MRIIVCMKQVPASSRVEIDPETRSMKRLSQNTRTNPYDLFALETALRIKEKVGGSVTVLTMGPPHAEEMIRDAYAMGADEGVILSDRKFAGADVLATSFTLSQGIKALGDYDLIICGKQTTDGDTAQVAPALAEHLGITVFSWISEIIDIDPSAITVRQEFVSLSQVSRADFPCLISVDKDINVPRLPSYKLKKAALNKTIRILNYSDMPKQDLSRYGLVGSPTSVERMFEPPKKDSQIYLEGDASEKSEKLISALLKKKVI